MIDIVVAESTMTTTTEAEISIKSFFMLSNKLNLFLHGMPNTNTHTHPQEGDIKIVLLVKCSVAIVFML